MSRSLRAVSVRPVRSEKRLRHTREVGVSSSLPAALHRRVRPIMKLTRLSHSDKTKKAFDLAQESRRLRERYGPTAFGQGALAARRLVEAGVRFVTISLGGWDTHGQNFNNLQDQAAAAARPDAVGPDRRTWTSTACSTRRSSTAPASSAGRRRSTRTPAATTGRGRWRWCWPAAASSAATPTARPTSRAWPRRRRPARRTTCRPRSSDSLGIDPKTELQTPTGRPIQLFREGKPEGPITDRAGRDFT